MTAVLVSSIVCRRGSRATRVTSCQELFQTDRIDRNASIVIVERVAVIVSLCEKA